MSLSNSPPNCSCTRAGEGLLAAAQEAFSRLGYGGASADMIAAEAGFSRCAFYSNFPNKEAILLELRKGESRNAVLGGLVGGSGLRG